ncbi:CoA transferase [soil metagenome]
MSACGPLSGVKVSDLTINVLGPVATQALGDMGADVIKVEPREGDPLRQTGPARNSGVSAFFLNMNRNKRSIMLDLKDPQEAEKLHELVDQADVFVHSMRAKAIEKLGFGHETLCARNQRLIYASAPGYSSQGPYRDRPAYDDVIQGQSGLADMMDIATGEPRFLPTVIADKFCGTQLASAISMALYARERTGMGQRVEVPMLETMLAFNLVEHLWGGTFGDGDLGYGRALSRQRRPYATQDGFLCVMPQSDVQWRDFFGICKSPQLAHDERFATLAARTRHIDALYGIVAEHLKLRTTGAWQTDLDACAIPNTPIARLAELPSDPYLRETGFFFPYEHPSEGPLVGISIPQKFSGTPASIRRAPPLLGQHNEEILGSKNREAEA